MGIAFGDPDVHLAGTENFQGACMKDIILQIKALKVGYGTRTVLEGIDLNVARGEWFALLGPNGSGKTTLLRAIAGQLTFTGGTVRIGGHCVQEAPELAKRMLGFAHPPERLPDLLTGRQCLEVYAAAHELTEIGASVLALAERFRLTSALDRAVETYSLGMRQKLCALLALVNEPALFVLDEVFNGLDPASALILKQELATRVEQGRCAVVLATHALDIVLGHADRAGLLLEGELAKIWDAPALSEMRAGTANALEVALAAVTRTEKI
jgi:ABC-2 type transport system ATP-binding protein